MSLSDIMSVLSYTSRNPSGRCGRTSVIIRIMVISIISMLSSMLSSILYSLKKASIISGRTRIYRGVVRGGRLVKWEAYIKEDVRNLYTPFAESPVARKITIEISSRIVEKKNLTHIF